jgi:hypothetical protein
VPPTLDAPAPVPLGHPAPPVVQRARASSPTAPVRTGFVDAGAVAVAAGLAHRAADGSVVFQPPASTTTGVVSHSATAPSRPAASRAGSPAPTVQRVLDGPSPPVTESPVVEPRTEAFAPPVGPSPSGPTPGVPAQETPAAPIPPSPATPSPTTATATPAAMSDRDVDRLARRLYPRLRDHLRGELRLDRERLGRASDLGLRS